MHKPFMTQRLSREKAVQRYLTALGNGDFQTIDLVWQQAAADPLLEQFLFKLHETFQNEQTLMATLQEENMMPNETGSVNSLPIGSQPSSRRHGGGRRHWSALVRMLAAVLLVGIILSGLLVGYLWYTSRLAAPFNPRPTVNPTPTELPISRLQPLCQATLPASYQSGTSLEDVLALSNSDVWIVGSYQSQPLALHWNGARWLRVTVPMPAAQGAVLNRVAALSPSDIWAVGSADTGFKISNSRVPISHTLVEHWDGTHWNLVPSPDLLPSNHNILQGIAAITPNDVWAVGAAGIGIAKSGYFSTSSPLLEHWDGTSWRLVSLPPVNSAAGLNGIVALNASDIWAAGSFSTNGDNSQDPLLEHWNGQSWSQTPSQALNGGAQGRLLAIAADVSHHLWALGTDSEGLPLLLRKNGIQWPSAPLPNLSSSSFYIQLLAIYPAGPQDIWLAGATVSTNDSTSTPLVEHWDGHQWQAVPERYQGLADLQAISVSAGTIWTAGYVDLNYLPFVATTCKL